MSAIAAESGMSTSSLMPSNLDQVYADTERRIGRAYSRLMASAARPDYVPRFRMRRRVEALMALGWTSGQIALAAQVARAAIVRTNGESVLASTFEAVEITFRRLRYSPGPSRETERRAREAGYAPWAAWPQGAMDREGGKPDFALVDDPVWREAIRSRYG